MKKIFVQLLIAIIGANYCLAQEECTPLISFGTALDAKSQIEAARKNALSIVDPQVRYWRAKGDQHRNYFLKRPMKICHIGYMCLKIGMAKVIYR